jgi:hypothetical protein
MRTIANTSLQKDLWAKKARVDIGARPLATSRELTASSVSIALVSLFSSLAIPCRRLISVLRNARSIFVHRTESELRSGKSLICCLAKPCEGLGIVLRNAPSTDIQVAKFGLRHGEPLIAGCTVQCNGLGVILGYAIAVFVHLAEIVLRPSISLIRIVREHRETLARTRNIARRLIDELEATTGHLGEIEAAIAAATEGDDSPKRHDAMMRAVSLPARTSVLVGLAQSLDRLFKLDRQAFGIGASPADEAQCTEAARLLELHAQWRAMTPLQKARALGAYIEERMREVQAVTAAPAPQS